ncbi:MAG: thioether cross-link-forming SCIFF peptide maturase [Peptococcales bacterium]
MQELNFNNIHKFSFKDFKILLDINSGSVHVIDEITWDYLDELENQEGNWEKSQETLGKKYETNLLNDVRGELQELIANNLLFSEDIDLDLYQPNPNPVVKALCLHVAHDCNLRCGYCFAGTGAFGGQRSLMSREVGQRAIDFLLAGSQNRKHVEVDFFGGEPLLNFDVVKELVAYGNKKAQELGKIIKFTITTNGVLLSDEVQQFLNENNMSVVLSLDGREKTNDHMRPFPNGSGSYALIKDKFLKFVKSRNQTDYYVRGTFTRYNLDFAEDVKHLAELGFKEISVEPVVAEVSLDYAFKEEDLPFLKEQYNVLTKYFWDSHVSGRGFNFFHYNIDLNHGPCLPKRLSGCGAGHEYLAVSPEGDLYPCHQFVGQKKYRVGNVYKGLEQKELAVEFQKSHVLSKEECRKCWARFYCSGGCHANNLNYGGSLLKPYTFGCELQRKRLECAIYLQVKKTVEQ